MKHLIASFLLMLFILEVNAQINLVPNPSFEDTVYCSYFGYMNACKDWVNCGESPDYNNACNQSGFSVPYNYAGYQLAATGTAYCDVWTYADNQLYREYIGATLIYPMTIGHTYDVSFKCSRANFYCVKTNKLGIRFSTVEFDSVNTPPINNFAHVYTDELVSDTAGWTTISGVFTADSTYTFLTIGNFFNDANTDTAGPCWGFGVYYIDDVSVSEHGRNTASLSIYQADHILHVSLDNDESKEITLFNVLGQTGYSFSNTTAQTISIDTTPFATAIYLIRVRTPSQTFVTKYFIH